jgi:hypothetical protein
MNCIGPVLQRIVAYTRLRESVRQPHFRITQLGEAADADDTWQWSINGLRKSNWIPSAIPKKSPAIASRGARWLGALPKSCHLLPPAAILGRKTATLVSTVTFLFLPLEGVPASLGPGLRTVSGAERGLGAKLSPTAVCPMTGESANSQKMLLAAAIADGTSVAKWASSNEVPERTAYRWTGEPGPGAGKKSTVVGGTTRTFTAANRQDFSHREADEKSLLDEASRRGIGGAGTANGRGVLAEGH